MFIVLLGPPGAGKGTQAQLICKQLGIPQGEAANYIRQYLARFPELKLFMDKAKDEARTQETNEAGEVTEGTIGNVVAVIDGVWTTPPREAGLLGGVFREALIRKCALVERPLPLAAFKAATQLFLINSVRGWCRLAVHMA